MFGNKRKEFNARVSLLFPGFGFTLDDAGVFRTLEALDAAWERMIPLQACCPERSVLPYQVFLCLGRSRLR